jgi:hypothetical protein
VGDVSCGPWCACPAPLSDCLAGKAAEAGKLAANRWLDNIDSLRGWCKKTFVGHEEELSNFFKEVRALVGDGVASEVQVWCLAPQRTPPSQKSCGVFSLLACLQNGAIEDMEYM